MQVSAQLLLCEAPVRCYNDRDGFAFLLLELYPNVQRLIHAIDAKPVGKVELKHEAIVKLNRTTGVIALSTAKRTLAVIFTREA